MRKTEETILDLRAKGYSCSQATLVGISRCSDTPMPDETILKAAASGLRGGIGRTFGDGTCGALTGTVIALGLLYADDEKRSAKLSKELFNRFKEKFGTVCCGDITDANGHKRCNECCVFAGRCLEQLCPEK